MSLDLYSGMATGVEPAGNEARETAYRVLVVDDEISMRDYATEALKYGGYEVVAVEAGKAAILALREQAFDLVVTDFNMPNGSGGDLITQMHQEGFMVPVIMMTGAELTKELLALISMLHVQSILQKPFKIDELLFAVDKALHPIERAPDDLAHHGVRPAASDSSHVSHEKRY